MYLVHDDGVLAGGRRLTLTIVDPGTRNRVTVEVPAKRQPRRIRRQVLRMLDEVSRPADQVQKSA